MKNKINIEVGSTASAYYKLKSSAKFGKVRQNEEKKEIVKKK